MLTPRERNYIEDMERRVNRMRSFLSEQPLPVRQDSAAWYAYLSSLKDIQGNPNTDVSFAATMMVKSYLEARYCLQAFDAAEKPQCAPGLDVDLRLPDGRRLVAEIKTTVPYKPNDLGAQQKVMFEKDFAKLTAEKADVKLFFLTERKTFELMKLSKYRSKLAGVLIVLLPGGEEIAA